MNTCSMCGVTIPEDQDICSVCYGDIDYGTDGYYRDAVERQMWEDHERQQREQSQ